MRESVKIIDQALDGLPEGPYITDNRKYALPPRDELATSMEALIHHFKLVTEGFRVPPGEYYSRSSRRAARWACFVLADGSAKPARACATQSFMNLQAFKPMVQAPLHRRPDRHARDARPDPGRDRPLMAIDLSKVRASPTGRASPAGTRRPTSPRTRRSSPTRPPRRCRRTGIAREIEAMRATRTRARQRSRRCTSSSASTAGAHDRDRAGGLRAAAHPAYLTAATFYDMFSTTPKGRHDVYVCTNISCSLLGADALFEEMLSAAGDDPEFNVQSFECLGACDIAPMASVDGEYGPARGRGLHAIVDDVKAGRGAAGQAAWRRKIAVEYWRET